MKENKDLALAITVTAAVLLGYMMAISLVSSSAWDTTDINEVPMQDVANNLFDEYSFALVILGMLLAASVLGGIYLARKEVKEVKEE
ncbi:MAG: NADH-quinone oxidoreductase subunit J [Thermoplasmata archaeon]|nr:NADH-quinone oxidoreductase subunit J [Thermoplasmata archaeon]